jgi:hypothetical protein
MLYGTDATSQAQYHDMRYRYTDRQGSEVTEDALYARRGYYFNDETHGMHYGEFANYLEAFARAIIEGSSHSPDLIEGLETVCVMEGARRSATGGGRPVALDELYAEVGLPIAADRRAGAT